MGMMAGAVESARCRQPALHAYISSHATSLPRTSPVPADEVPVPIRNPHPSSTLRQVYGTALRRAPAVHAPARRPGRRAGRTGAPRCTGAATAPGTWGCRRSGVPCCRPIFSLSANPPAPFPHPMEPEDRKLLSERPIRRMPLARYQYTVRMLPVPAHSPSSGDRRRRIPHMVHPLQHSRACQTRRPPIR